MATQQEIREVATEVRLIAQSIRANWDNKDYLETDANELRRSAAALSKLISQRPRDFSDQRMGW